MKTARAITVLAVAAVAVGCATIAPGASVVPGPSAVATASAEVSVPATVALATLAPSTIGPATIPPTANPVTAPPRTPKPAKTPKPTRRPTPEAATITSFTAPETIDCNVDPEPTTVHVEWAVSRADGIELYIDSGPLNAFYVGETGSTDLAFACAEPQHEYTLKTTGGEGAPATKSITVKRALPKIRNVYADNLTIQGTCAMVYQRRVYWNVENATGVTVTVGGQTYGPYLGHDNNAVFPYDCTNSPTVTYRVETTGYGPAATFDYVLPYATE